jgi:large subunit ribosomal protein L6
VTLSVGFTPPVKITAPKDVSFEVIENTKITVSGIDKKVVGEIAAKLRAIRPPEPYKGKGVRYVGEVVRKKAGKAVKAAGAAT